MAGKIIADTLEHSTAGSLTTDYVVNGSAKAWMHMPNGGASTISLSDSLNTSSISDGGTGIYTPSWTNNMNNATYEFSLASQRGASFADHPTLNSMATGSMQMAQSNASAYVNSAIYTASIHGDLA
jgi:hypothetical protein